MEIVPPEQESLMRKASRESNERREEIARVTSRVFERNTEIVHTIKFVYQLYNMVVHIAYILRSIDGTRNEGRLEAIPTNAGSKLNMVNDETKTLSQIEDDIQLALIRKALVKEKDKVVSSAVNDVISRRNIEK
ncbi:hypothetical protein C5167_004707 [Papaver somniferum]|uniref:Uncharacterized protein n=1 Tax=Papaver somniferum TaxID=3469 RepID=A0A4Y7J8D3_PAPSO|nr:hypothetical protein C5167_004707 [Papaver somniferum]